MTGPAELLRIVDEAEARIAAALLEYRVADETTRAEMLASNEGLRRELEYQARQRSVAEARRRAPIDVGHIVIRAA